MENIKNFLLDRICIRTLLDPDPVFLLTRIGISFFLKGRIRFILPLFYIGGGVGAVRSL